MHISPIDIQKKEFKSRFMGYEKGGVDQFLELLADEMERLRRQIDDLKGELNLNKTALSEMRERESTLKETLVTTQKVTDELRANARREVDVLIAEAELKAERVVRNAEERRMQLIEDIQEIKRQKIDFESSLRSLLEKHVRMLDLNLIAIEENGSEARLLEEPLPFDPPDVPDEIPSLASGSEIIDEDPQA
ncbi:MAG: DivIVA domain-containing protein [Desulfuromonadales bacterium]|jgi:cell division initiation protein|nr:DivIVA domain-containing protein [Desulfuromonadales bacterium]